jgi:trimeric autotransporter adhesin
MRSTGIAKGTQKNWNRLIFLLSTSILVGQPSTGEAQPFLGNGLIAYYPFDGNANDAVGTNHGAVVGATLVADRLGNQNSAYSFDGTTYIQCPDAGLPSGSSARSVSLWIRIAAFGGITYPFGYGAGVASSAFYTCVDEVNSGGPYIEVGMAGGGDLPRWHGPTTNVWYHVVVTYSNSLASLYINGGNPVQASRTYATALTGAFYIGGNFQAPAGPPTFFGAIDDVRVYNRALSAQEIAQLYQYEAGPGSDCPRQSNRGSRI